MNRVVEIVVPIQFTAPGQIENEAHTTTMPALCNSMWFCWKTTPRRFETGEVTALELRFYVILPDDATKAPQRETDYVIPRGTLNQILQDDSEEIEAIVRDSVAPSITTVESSLNSWKVIAISFLVITAVLISVIAVVVIAVAIYKYKQR